MLLAMVVLCCPVRKGKVVPVSSLESSKTAELGGEDTASAMRKGEP